MSVDMAGWAADLRAIAKMRSGDRRPDPSVTYCSRLETSSVTELGLSLTWLAPREEPRACRVTVDSSPRGAPRRRRPNLTMCAVTGGATPTPNQRTDSDHLTPAG